MRHILLILSLFGFVEAKTVLWFTGLPCSGKTTIAEHVCEIFPDWVHLDGDVIRKAISADLGFSIEDRQKNLQRIAHVALANLESANTVLVTTISPLESHREMVREILEKGGARFYIVYVKADLDTCIQRDVKGMYAKALRGEIREFTGISSPYEPPENPSLIFDTDQESLEQICCKLKEFLSFNASSAM